MSSGRALHHGELAMRDHVLRGGHQRAVQRDDVAGADDFVEGGVQRPHPLRALVGGKENAHAQRPPDLGDGPAQDAVTHDPERRSREIADREIEEAELACFLPTAADHRLPVRDDAAPEGKDQGEGVLRNGVDRVVADVGDDDPALGACLEIDDVRAGGGHGDEPELRSAEDGLPVERRLVRDDDLGVPDAFGDLIGRRPRMDRQGMGKCDLPQTGLGRERIPIEKHDMRRILRMGHLLLPDLLWFCWLRSTGKVGRYAWNLACAVFLRRLAIHRGAGRNANEFFTRNRESGSC